MIVFIASIVFLLVVIALMITLSVTKWKLMPIPATLIICVSILCMMIVAISLIINIGTFSTNKSNFDEYMDLAVYYNAVNESDDEVMRWHYYNKINEWNEKYENYLRMNNNMWFGFFYGDHDYDGCDFINLELRQE